MCGNGLKNYLVEVIDFDIFTEMLEKLQEQDNARVILDSIREDIRNSLPVEALTRTETIVCPEMGPVSYQYNKLYCLC